MALTYAGQAAARWAAALMVMALCMLAAWTAAPPAQAAAGGPLVLMGIDAEDGGPGAHGPIANYTQVVNSILNASSNGANGIAVFGRNGSNVHNFWNAISSATGEPVTFVAASDISTVNLAGFQMLAVASDYRNTSGGLRPAENQALGARRADVAAFVNNGGGLLGFSSGFSSVEGGPYPYLADLGSFTFNTNLNYSNVTPTSDGVAIGITNAFDVCCWHDEYVTFPSFLKVLATNASTGRAAAIGGVNVVISDIQLTPPSQSAPTGSTQTVTATVNETVNGTTSPVAGTTVTFTAVSGPNAGPLGTGITDSSGQASLSYSSLTSGTDTVEASFVDSKGVTQTSNRVLVEWEASNQAPQVNAGGPYSGEEGTPLTLSGSASDPDGPSPLTLSWTYSPVSGVDTGASCVFGDASAAVTTFACTDDGTYHVELKATDGLNASSDSVAVTILDNVAPSITTINAPVDPLPVNTSVNVDAPFTDPGSNDTHTCTVDWGDGNSSPGTIASGSCDASHTYTAAGIYTLQVTVTDDDGGSDSEIFQYVVVYDPDAGFVTGGGWIDSPAGAYTADATLSGRASFGFVSKYKKGATVPDGQTQFQFHAGDLNFHSTAYEWLVVSGPKAQYKGSGTINGAGNYGFMLTVNDGQQTGGGDVDRFRIKIWDNQTGNVVYDNQIGDADDDAASDAIEGGSIVIHSKNSKK